MRDGKANTKTKTEKKPICVIFSISSRFEDIKYDNERGCCTKSEGPLHIKLPLIFNALNITRV